ncbi:MAG: hypothetical protein FJ119_00450 [Deltaproteobacteria bacterium]|nr:hypothetical protein [Deltaproteobacteria bacterium]
MGSRVPFKTMALLTLACCCLAALDYHNFPYNDGAEHGAVVRELAENPFSPGEPMLGTFDGNSARYVPSALLMAFASRLLSLDVLLVIKLFTVIYFVFFVAALSLFTYEYFADMRSALWSLLAVLFLWGTGWYGANAFMFSALLSTAWFPSLVSFSCALLALYFQLRFIKTRSFSMAFLQYSFAAVSFVCHPLTWVFYFICSVLLCCERQGGSLRPIMVTGVISVVTALCAVAVWPYYDFISNFVNVASGGLARTASDYQTTRDYLYSDIVLRIGPALAGIAGLVVCLKKRKHLLLWGGCAVFAGLYAAGYFLHISLAERFVFFTVFLLQLSFARIAALASAPGAEPVFRLPARMVTYICASVLACGIVIQVGLVWRDVVRPCFVLQPSFPFMHYESPNREHMGLDALFGSGDVVFTDIFSGWSIPVYTGARVVALLHTPPHVPDNYIRVRDSNAFFMLDRPLEEKWEILRRYSPSHILLNYRIIGPDMEPVLRGMGFEPLVQTESYVVFAVPSDSLGKSGAYAPAKHD